MYVRKKTNRSGRTSVVIVEKCNGKIHYIKIIGVSADRIEIDDIHLRWVSEQTGARDMFLKQVRARRRKSC